MPRLVIHCAYGGFGAFNLDCEHDHGLFDQEGRDCPALLAHVEANPDGKHRIVDVPDDADWYIDEYDGFEVVREGRTWSSTTVEGS